MARLERNRVRADALENLTRDRFRDRAAGRGLEHERGGIGGGEPVAEPVQPKVGDRGDVDQHLRDHHERQRENQKLGR
jgi:hypothetical protein